MAFIFVFINEDACYLFYEFFLVFYNKNKMKRKGRNYWTKEKCIKEAKNYKKRTKFARGSESAYNSARNNKWLDEVCSHMGKVDKNPKGYWTKERCVKEALKHSSKKELYKKSSGAYMSMLNNNWLLELCPHMKTKKPNGYWTKDRCTEEALKYMSKTEFQIKSGGAYRASIKHEWISEFKFKI